MGTMRELKLNSTLLLFASFAVIATALLEPERFTFNPSDCSPDEEFLRCGSVCSPTCESIFKPENSLICTRQCVIGCFCKQGLVRDVTGRCIPREACPRPDTARSDRSYTQEKIDDTGDEYRPGRQPSRGPDSRPDTRPQSQSNIKPERATFSPNTCRVDEEYKHCGSVCDDTCSTVFATELRPCTLQCVSGCFCKPPLVRDVGEACVPATQCSNTSSVYPPQGSPDSREGRGSRKFPPQSPDGRRPDTRDPRRYPQRPDSRYPPSYDDGVFGQRFRPQVDSRGGRDDRYSSQQPGERYPSQKPDGRYPSRQPDGRDDRYPSQPESREDRQFRPQSDSRDGRDGRGFTTQSPEGKDSRFRPTSDGRDGRYPYEPDSRDGRFPSRPDYRDDRQFRPRPDGRDGRYPSQQPQQSDSRYPQPGASDYIKPDRNVTNPRDCRRDENYQTCGSVCDDTCSNMNDRGARPYTYQCVTGCYCNKPLVRAVDGSCVRPENCPEQNTTSREGRSGQRPQYPGRPQYPQDSRYPQYPQQSESPQDSRYPRYPQQSQSPQDARYPQQPQSPQDPRYPQYPQQPQSPQDSRYPRYPQQSQSPQDSRYPRYPQQSQSPQDPRYPQYPQYTDYPQSPQQYPTQEKEPFPKSDGNSSSKTPGGQYPTQQSPFDSQCGPNETFLTCGSACVDTCDSIYDPRPGGCTYQCVVGCFCTQGLVRDRQGNCVHRNQCPTPPQYSTKGRSSNVPRDAIIHSPSISVSPTNRANTAIESGRRTLNANECRADEVYQTCGTRCADNCENIFEEGPKFCTYECVIGCFCKPPLVRAADGSCVSRQQCPGLVRRPRSYFVAGSSPLPIALRQSSPQPSTGCHNDGFETTTQILK